MGRSVVAHVEEQVADLLGQGGTAQLQIGLLIGKSGVASRDYILGLVPTPPSDTEAEQQGCRADAQVDTDWMGEHARQVSRMLPGGIVVLGLYAVCSDAAVKAAGAQLGAALAAVMNSADLEGQQDGLILHITAQPRRFACRSGALAQAGGAFSSLQPCELKLLPSLSGLHCLHASYNLNLRLPVLGGPQASMQSSVEGAIRCEAARLSATECTVDGALADRSQPVSTLIRAGEQAAAGSTASHTVHFFARPHWESGAEKSEGQSLVSGHVRLSGVVHLRAYAHPKQTIEEALNNLQTDLSRSLRARLGILVEQAERPHEQGELSDGAPSTRGGVDAPACASPSKPPHPLLEEAAPGKVLVFAEGLPRRVLVPWVAGVQLSEYLSESESITDAEERCFDMLGARFLPRSGQLVEVEAQPTLPATLQRGGKAEDKLKVPAMSNSGIVMSKERVTCAPSTFIAAVGALAALSLAIALAYASR